MALGHRRTERQEEFWVATSKLPGSISHVFYDALNGLLGEGGFDEFVETLCEAYYEDGGRPGIPPGIYFRMIFVGYFEGLDSQRGPCSIKIGPGGVETACRCGSFWGTAWLRTLRTTPV